MSEYITSIKAILYDRVVSPLFGIFAISWTICNYKLFVVLLSDMDAVGKIVYIEYALYGDNSKWLPLLAYPTAATLFAIFVYPLLAKPVFERFTTNRASLSKRKGEIDSEYLDEKIKLLTEKLRDQRVEFSNEIQLRDADNARYLQALKATREELDGLKQTHSADEVESQLNSEADLSLNEIGRRDDFKETSTSLLSESQARLLMSIDTNDVYESNFDRETTRRRYDRDVLLKLGFVRTKRKYNPHGDLDYLYSTTPSGREYIIDHSLDTLTGHYD